MFWNDITFGMMLVSLAGLAVSQGYLLKTQARGLALHAEMLRAQAELAALCAEMRAAQAVGMHPVASWRELPPEGRQQLRKALMTVLAEIDADGAVRH